MAYRKTKNTKSDPKTGKRISMWTKARKAKVYKMYVKQRLGVIRIAKELGCSHMAVYNLVRANGWNRRDICQEEAKRTRQFLDKNRKRIHRMYETMSAQEIATSEELSLGSVIGWLKAEGVFITSGAERIKKAIKRGVHAAAARPKQKMRKVLSLNVNALHHLEYRKLAGYVTGRVFAEHRHVLDPRNKRSYEWHLDHIFSVKNAVDEKIDGEWFPRKERVPLWALCHPANLQMLPRSLNSRKHNTDDPLNSSIKELKKRIRMFNKKYGNPFQDYGIEV